MKRLILLLSVLGMQEISRISYTIIYCGSAICLPSVWNAGCFGKSPVYTCARINIKVDALLTGIDALKICSTAYFENQWLSGKTAKKYEKRVADVWRICRKAVILHPLSREKRRWVEILNKDEVLNLTASKKTFFKKKLQKVLVVQK